MSKPTHGECEVSISKEEREQFRAHENTVLNMPGAPEPRRDKAEWRLRLLEDLDAADSRIAELEKIAKPPDPGESRYTVRVFDGQTPIWDVSLSGPELDSERRIAELLLSAGRQFEDVPEDTRDTLPATRKQLNYLEALLEECFEKYGGGVGGWEEWTGTRLSELTRAQASDEISRWSGRAV